MAQGTYTVTTEPVAGTPYENKKGSGNLVPWRLGLKDATSTAPDGLFELHKKEGNSPPKVGDTIEVERFIEDEFDNQPRVRIKQVYGGGGGSQQSDGPGLKWQSKPFERGAEHPRNEARVIHTSALSATPAYIEQLLTISLVDQPTNEAEYWKLVGKVATKLTRSYEAAMSLEPQQPLPVAAQEVPADTADLEPQSQVADASIPF